MSAPSSTASRRADPGLDDDLFGFDGAAALIRARSRGLRPDPALKVSSWADRHRKLASRASAEPGQYGTARTPYMRRMMDRLSPGERAFAMGRRLAREAGAFCGGSTG